MCNMAQILPQGPLRAYVQNSLEKELSLSPEEPLLLDVECGIYSFLVSFTQVTSPSREEGAVRVHVEDVVVVEGDQMVRYRCSGCGSGPGSERKENKCLQR